jgi:DNA ligase (NAD+)
MHRCPNRACPSRGLETLIHWVQAAMDIEGIGEKFVRKLWSEGLLRSMPDLYRLRAEQLIELEGYGEISAQRAIEAIEQSKQQPFFRVLFGLNIPYVGFVTAQALAYHFGSIEKLAAATQEEIQAVEGVGPVVAEAVAEWFADEENTRLVAELAELGLRLELTGEERPVEGRLSGNTYVITGTLEHFSRAQAQAALEERGAKVTDSVSAKTTAVIAGENPGSKLEKARRAGVEIFDERGLEELLRG